MFSRRRTPLVVAAACLVLASGAAAAEGDAFTARATPSHVKPGVAASFTVTLTNDPSPSGEANGATIFLPADFAVTGQPKEPSITGCGDPRDWDIQLLSAGRIELAKHDGAANNLCPGGTLSVEFSATPTTEEGSYDWAVELFRDNETFTLHPPQPTVVVDGTAPETTIASGPPPVTNQTTAGFAFSSEPGSTFQCRLDNQPVESCTSPKTYVGLTPGPHSVLVQATDPAGNAELNPANHVWTIDLTPPTVAITGKPSEQTSRNAATFSFVASEGQTRPAIRRRTATSGRSTRRPPRPRSARDRARERRGRPRPSRSRPMRPPHSSAGSMPLRSLPAPRRSAIRDSGGADTRSGFARSIPPAMSTPRLSCTAGRSARQPGGQRRARRCSVRRPARA